MPSHGQVQNTIPQCFLAYRASLIVETVKTLPAIRETWVRSWGWEDPLEEGMATDSSMASLVTQLVKNPPAMPETWVRFLGQEDPLEKGKATHSSVLPGEFHGLYSPWGHEESDTTLHVM